MRLDGWSLIIHRSQYAKRLNFQRIPPPAPPLPPPHTPPLIQPFKKGATLSPKWNRNSTEMVRELVKDPTENLQMFGCISGAIEAPGPFRATTSSVSQGCGEVGEMQTSSKDRRRFDLSVARNNHLHPLRPEASADNTYVVIVAVGIMIPLGVS